MNVVASPASGLMAHAVREAVDSVAAPDRRESVISLALRWAGLPSIPEAGKEVGEFIENSLYRAAEEVLGAESASMIVEQLRPIAEMIGREEISEIRRSYPELAAVMAESDDERPISKVDAAPARRSAPGLDLDLEDIDHEGDYFDDDEDDPVVIVLDEDGNEEEEESVLQTGRVMVTQRPRRGEVPFILVSTEDPSSISALNQALGGAATLEPVGDALAVLQGLTDGRASLLVVDCARPTVRLETLLALTPELPDGTRIVLWSEPRDLAQRLTGGLSLPASWVCAGSSAGAEDIGAICRVLLG